MQIQIKSKRTIAIIAVIAAVLIIITGAFAWNSINQQRINLFREAVVPGVNLHDDFEGGPEKDVYVENSGEVRVIVRVRLTEYLETKDRGSLVVGHVRDGETAKLGWTPHSGTHGVSECTPDYYYLPSAEWSTNDWFHEYYTWTMGGEKYYMPAIYQLGEDDKGNSLAFADNPEVCTDLTVYDGTEENVKKTLDADVITMASWLADGRKQGEFWVVDTDGWCYWAQMLEPEQATGLLLSKVERTDKVFDSSAEYCINVWLQAVDEIDTDLFNIAENGGITDNAKVLAQILADKILVAEDGSLYENSRDGTFTKMTDTSGNTLENPRAFIPLGSYADVYAKINAPDENRLYLGDKLDLDTLGWNGDEFTNYGDALNLGVPWYNIAINSDSGDYTAHGSETGADGILYIRVTDSTGEFVHLASVLEESGTYSHGYPGTAPFGIVYQGGDRIGTKNDSYYPIGYEPNTLEQRFFYHIGNGVYVEIEDEDDTESKDDPITYYFSSRIFADEPLVIDDSDGLPLDVKVEATFSFSLYIGEKFCVWDSKETGCTIILKGEEMDAALHVMEGVETTFTMLELYELNGQLYIDLNENDGGYKNLYISGTGENGEFGGQYFGDLAEENGGVMTLTVSNKAPGTGTQDSPFKIQSRYEMDWITGEVLNGNNFEGKYFVVKNDFSMGAKDFLPIGSNTNNQFCGNFDGGGFTISDLKITSSANHTGLFGYVGTNCVISNVKLDKVAVIGGNYTSGITSYNLGKIENCHVLSGTVSGGAYTSGVASANTGTITGCSNAAAVTGSNNIASGIAGLNSGGIVTDCSNTGTVKGVGSVGGVVGYNQQGSVITGCENGGEVTGTADNIGGIAGGSVNGSSIQDSKNSGTVTGSKRYTGGVTGFNAGTPTATVSNSHNTGKISGATETGGVVGSNGTASSPAGTVTGCYNTGEVTGSGNYTGGVVGRNVQIASTAKDITNCYNTGTVTGNGYTGGVTGSNGTTTVAGGTISNCYSQCTVNGGSGSITGGIVGYNKGTVKNCYVWGNVTGSSMVGGITGQTDSGSVSYSYHFGGTVSGTIGIGGIVGMQPGGNTLTRCVAFTDKVTGTNSYIGRVLGMSGNATMDTTTVTNNYYWSSMTIASSTNYGTGVANKTQAETWWKNTVGFDFTTTWRWDSTAGLPLLQGVTP